MKVKIFVIPSVVKAKPKRSPRDRVLLPKLKRPGPKLRSDDNAEANMDAREADLIVVLFREPRTARHIWSSSTGHFARKST
jgi:hypothetical protein